MSLVPRGSARGSVTLLITIALVGSLTATAPARADEDVPPAIVGATVVSDVEQVASGWGAFGVTRTIGYEDDGELFYFGRAAGSNVRLRRAGVSPPVTVLGPQDLTHSVVTEDGTKDIFVGVPWVAAGRSGIQRIGSSGTAKWTTPVCPAESAHDVGANTLMPGADGNLIVISSRCSDGYGHEIRSLNPATGAVRWQKTTSQLGGVSLAVEILPYDGGLIVSTFGRAVYVDHAGNVTATVDTPTSVTGRGGYVSGYGHDGKLWRLFYEYDDCANADLVLVQPAGAKVITDYSRPYDLCADEIVGLPDGSALAITPKGSSAPDGGTLFSLVQIRPDGTTSYREANVGKLGGVYLIDFVGGVDLDGNVLITGPQRYPCVQSDEYGCWGGRYSLITPDGALVETTLVGTGIPAVPQREVFYGPELTLSDGAIFDYGNGYHDGVVHHWLTKVPLPSVRTAYPMSRYVVRDEGHNAPSRVPAWTAPTPKNKTRLDRPLSESSTVTVAAADPDGDATSIVVRFYSADLERRLVTPGWASCDPSDVAAPSQPRTVCEFTPGDGTHLAIMSVQAVDVRGKRSTLREFLVGASSYKYVALGDSYSAGEGVDPYFEDGYDVNTGTQTGGVANRCHRSTRGYPTYVKPPGYEVPLYEFVSSGSPGSRSNLRKYGSDLNQRSRDGAIWVNLACSGAVMDNVKPVEQGGAPQAYGAGYREILPQLSYGQVNYDTDLVTITISGNDVGFADVLADCASLGDNCNTTANEAALASTIRDQEMKLAGLLGEAQRRTYGARLVVAGYPRLFPGSGRGIPCASRALITRPEEDMLNRLSDELNAMIRRATRTVSAEFIDISTDFTGHEICATGTSSDWIYGLSFTSKFLRGVQKDFFRPDDQSFHPTPEGHRAYATAFDQKLRNLRLN